MPVPGTVSGLPERIDAKIIDSLVATSGPFWGARCEPEDPWAHLPLSPMYNFGALGRGGLCQSIGCFVGS